MKRQICIMMAMLAFGILAGCGNGNHIVTDYTEENSYTPETESVAEVQENSAEEESNTENSICTTGKIRENKICSKPLK